MKYEISQEVLQKLVDYLGTKPFVEVHQLIAQLLQVKPIAEPKLEVAK